MKTTPNNRWSSGPPHPPSRPTRRQHRLAVGALTHAKADVLFLTNDNPGPDFPDRIVADVVSGLPPSAVDLNFPQLHTYPFMQASWWFVGC